MQPVHEEQEPLEHVLPPGQLMHATPPRPQRELVEATHEPLEQHPLAHV